MSRTPKDQVLVNQAKAVALRRQGKSYDEIADALGYASRSTAYRLVTGALTANVSEEVEVLRELEIERLDAIHRAFWKDALSGDVSAALIVLRASEQRGRLLGLDFIASEQRKPAPMNLVLTHPELHQHGLCDCANPRAATRSET